MDHHRRHCLLPLALILLFSCRSKPDQVDHAYYYWSSSGFYGVDSKCLKQQNINKLYVHVLDVDYSGTLGAIPVFESSLPMRYNELRYLKREPELIPVVFITNQTFQNIENSELPELAKRVVRRCLPQYDEIDKRFEKREMPWEIKQPLALTVPKEIQIDCDWTAGTSKTYFEFLEEVRKILPSDSIRVSATIRLHQFKYPDKSGVPPVDKGMLMVYNLADPRKYQLESSIYEQKRAEPYFSNKKPYPLPLDIALPAWSWSIIFRQGKFFQIEHNLRSEDLEGQDFVRKSGSNRYAITKDTVYRDLFLRPGDEIRTEEISPATLQQAATLARKAVNSKHVTIALFDLSSRQNLAYDSTTLQDVFQTFH